MQRRRDQHAFPQIRKELEKESITVCRQDFYCRGQFGVLQRGKPDARDLKSAKRFAADILAKAQETPNFADAG